MTLDDVRLAVGLGSLGSKKVLVVEDDLGHHARMLRWLLADGVEAVGLVAVRSMDGDEIVGKDAEDVEVRVALAEVGAAFLDYYFPGPFDGGRLARGLSNAGVRCFGMSSVGEKNREMVLLGAVGGLRKRELAALLP